MNINKLNFKGQEYNLTDADAQSKITSLQENTYTKTEVNSAISNKVDKVEGKGLSTNDYTSSEKTKLEGIEENANNYIHPTTSGNKHVPSGGADGQILVFSADGTAAWSDSSTKLDAQFEALNTAQEELQAAQQNLNKQVGELTNNIDLYSYGVEWDTTVASPIITRIGNPLLHKSLPIQSAYKGCIANQDVVNYYLCPDDWHYKAGELNNVIENITVSAVDCATATITLSEGTLDDGVYVKLGGVWGQAYKTELGDYKVQFEEFITDTSAISSVTSITVGANLSGADGTVRVETPKFYGISGSNGTKRWVRTSTVKFDDTWVEIPAMLIDAYRCTLDKRTSTYKTASVVNTTSSYRGGGNRSYLDNYLAIDLARTDLGKPGTSLPRSMARKYATNAGSELLCYEYYKWIFYWNYVIEYANFNAQAAYNAELTSDGYRQGGLGNGISNMSNWEWYNGYYPVTPCGYGNSIGNFTGVKPLVIPEFDYSRASRHMVNWTANSAVCVSANGSNNSKIVTEVKAVDNYAFTYNHNEVFEEVTYSVTGLTDGQKVIFKEKQTGSNYSTATVIAEATADGEIVVNWSPRGSGNDRYIGFEIPQTGCNIKIYLVKATSINITAPSQTLSMARWHGFDNPWGDTWTDLDGIIIERTVAYGPSNVYTTTDPTLFGDTQEAKAKMNLVGVEIASDGYIKTFDLRETAEIIPSSVGASTTTYKCDYHWCNPSRTDLRALLVGASAYNGGFCGPGAFYSAYGVGGSDAGVGFRTLNKLS